MNNLIGSTRIWLVAFLLCSAVFLCSLAPKSLKSNSFRYAGQDTTAFTPNQALGWGSHASYVAMNNDTVQFELILSRAVPPGNNWNVASLVGTITQVYAPAVEMTFEYVERPRLWEITLKPSGECYFKLLSGTAPSGQQILLPVQTHYKK